MAEVLLTWNGTRAKWVVRRAIAEGMERGAKFAVRVLRRKINVPFPPASEPGEPPRKRTGNLRNSIDYWINKKTLEVRIGPTIDAEYGIYLEYGVPRGNLDPRPFIVPTIEETRTRMANTVNRAAAIAFNKFGGR